MRLLLISDLHRDASKLLWLQEDASAHDALLVAGDLLDLFSKTKFPDQISGTLRWSQAVLATGKVFAWCSGNHDFFNGNHTPMSDASPLWMKEMRSTAVSISDGETKLCVIGNESIVITTLPWFIRDECTGVDGRRTSYFSLVNQLMNCGKQLREEKGIPWIVLCHEPPSGTPLAPSYTALGADLVRRHIESHQPDFSVHGHLHQAPTAVGGNWICRLGKSICFNAGQSSPDEPLNHILLEWKDGGDWTAQWHGEGMTLSANRSDFEA